MGIEFTANGKTYREENLSIERYKAYLKTQLQVGYDVGFVGTVEALQKIYKLCNEQKFADIAVTCHNMLKCIDGMDKREHPVLILCALFLNTEGEDKGAVDDVLIQAKIDDWKKEGIPMSFFLKYANLLVKDYEQIWKAISEEGPMANLFKDSLQTMKEE